MGCFFRCFRSPNDRKTRKQRNKIIPSHDQVNGNWNPLPIIAIVEERITQNPTDSVSEFIDKSEEQQSSSTGDAVEFDSNLENCENVSVQECTESLFNKEISAESNQSTTQSEVNSVTSSVGSYQPNYRYQNYQDSDDEIEELHAQYDSCFTDDDYVEEQEDYSDHNEDTDNRIVFEEPKPIGLLNPNGKGRSSYIHPVLNPIENLTQLKTVKSQFNPQKENLGEEELMLNFKANFDQPKNLNQETSVDASLSSWLVSKETSNTNKSNSSMGIDNFTPKKIVPQSMEDRPILGALTLEELREFSASNSPRRKSPSSGIDEMPIIGSVGSYWSHTDSVSSYKGKVGNKW